MLLAGIVLGGFMGQLAEGISWLSWLNYGQSFGLDSPLVINFGILVITFGLSIQITMASIIANQFGEADGLKLSSLIAIGLLLFLITAVINMIGKILIRRAQHV